MKNSSPSYLTNPTPRVNPPLSMYQSSMFASSTAREKAFIIANDACDTRKRIAAVYYTQDKHINYTPWPLYFCRRSFSPGARHQRKVRTRCSPSRGRFVSVDRGSGRIELWKELEWLVLIFEGCHESGTGG